MDNASVSMDVTDSCVESAEISHTGSCDGGAFCINTETESASGLTIGSSIGGLDSKTCVDIASGGRKGVLVSKACQTDIPYRTQEQNMCASSCDTFNEDGIESEGEDYHPSDTDGESSCSDVAESDFDIAALQRTRALCERHSKRYIGVPADSLFLMRMLAEDRIAPTFRSAKLEPYDVLLLVLMKIKQDRY